MKKVLIDFRTTEEEKCILKANNFDPIICPPSFSLYSAVCGHPDMLVHILDNNQIVVHKNTSPNFINYLRLTGKNVIKSQNTLTNKYPFDIFLNAVNLPSIFMHNLKYTDNEILTRVNQKKLINVKQGYTKCSTAIVSDRAVITSDKSIYKSLKNEDFDVLLLPPGDILLPGLNYGFIGGCCGLLRKDLMAFFGNLDYYIYGNQVKNFLYKYKIDPIYLHNGKLIDRGSLLIL